jgi:hypothetical protein
MELSINTTSKQLHASAIQVWARIDSLPSSNGRAKKIRRHSLSLNTGNNILAYYSKRKRLSNPSFSEYKEIKGLKGMANNITGAAAANL